MERVSARLDEEDAQVGVLAQQAVDEVLVAAPHAVPGLEGDDDEAPSVSGLGTRCGRAGHEGVPVDLVRGACLLGDRQGATLALAQHGAVGVQGGGVFHQPHEVVCRGFVVARREESRDGDAAHALEVTARRCGHDGQTGGHRLDDGQADALDRARREEYRSGGHEVLDVVTVSEELGGVRDAQ